jgi:Immunity protein 17
MPNWLVGLLVLGAGAFTITASVQNWEWFFTNARARLLVGLLGRQGARVFYGVLGAALAVGGVIALLAGPSSTR